jgi:WD40 repeat protein
MGIGFITGSTPPRVFDNPAISWMEGTDPFTIAVWDVDRKVQFSQQAINLSRKPILKFTPDNQRLTITQDENIQFCHRILDIQGCHGIYLNSIDTYRYASNVVFSPDSQSFAASVYSVGRDGTIYRSLFINALADQYYIIEKNDSPFIGGTTALFSPDSKLLLVGESNGFSPKNTLIATGGWASLMWDVAALKAVEPWMIHLVDYTQIPEAEETLQLWSIKELQNGSDKPLVTFDHQHIRGLMFNDAGTILFAYGDHRVTLWGIPE